VEDELKFREPIPSAVASVEATAVLFCGKFPLAKSAYFCESDQLN
jgi:hypothetical protein